MPNQDWRTLFPNVAAIEVVPDSSSPSIALRFTKKEGIPIHVVPEGTSGSFVVAIKKVNELGFFNMTRNQLSDAIHLNKPKTNTLIWYLKIKNDEDCCRAIQLGKTTYYKYSCKSISKIKEIFQNKTMEEIWDVYSKEVLNHKKGVRS